MIFVEKDPSNRGPKSLVWSSVPEARPHRIRNVAETPFVSVPLSVAYVGAISVAPPPLSTAGMPGVLKLSDGVAHVSPSPFVTRYVNQYVVLEFNPDAVFVIVPTEVALGPLIAAHVLFVLLSLVSQYTHTDAGNPPVEITLPIRSAEVDRTFVAPTFRTTGAPPD